jgi:hypothetical protein
MFYKKTASVDLYDMGRKVQGVNCQSSVQFQPPQDVHSTYYPARGCYSSRDPVVIREQMDEVESVALSPCFKFFVHRPSAISECKFGGFRAPVCALEGRKNRQHGPFPHRPKASPCEKAGLLLGNQKLAEEDQNIY